MDKETIIPVNYEQTDIFKMSKLKTKYKSIQKLLNYSNTGPLPKRIFFVYFRILRFIYNNKMKFCLRFHWYYDILFETGGLNMLILYLMKDSADNSSVQFG